MNSIFFLLTLIWHRFPEYPLVHLHENPPIWSVHIAPFKHGFDSHSLYSKLQSSPAKPVNKMGTILNFINLCIAVSDDNIQENNITSHTNSITTVKDHSCVNTHIHTNYADAANHSTKNKGRKKKQTPHKWEVN